MVAGPAMPAAHPLLGEHNAATLDPSGATLSTSDETLRKAILQAVQAASASVSLPPLKVDYPLDEAVFPPDMAAPTFVWSDPAAQADTWLIDVASGDGSGLTAERAENAETNIIKRILSATPATSAVKGPSDHLYVLTQGATPPRARDDDPRTLSQAAAAYEPPAPAVKPRRWMPEPDIPRLRSGQTWERIKSLSRGRAATVTITGFRSANLDRALSRGRFKLSTSDDAVGAPIFYRDVPLPFGHVL